MLTSNEYYKIVSEQHIKNGKVTPPVRKAVSDFGANCQMVIFDDVTGFVFRVHKESDLVSLVFYKSKKDWDSGINYKRVRISKFYGESTRTYRADELQDLNDCIFIKSASEKDIEFCPKDLI